MSDENETWLAGATYVVVMTIAEDATGGSHVCKLIINGSTGDETYFTAGSIVVGNTATAQSALCSVDDGTNHLFYLLNQSGTTANQEYGIPNSLNSVTAQAIPYAGIPITSTMRVILQVNTAAVSVTQTFAAVIRVRGGAPTVAGSDAVGTPTVTTVTSRFF